LKAAANTATDIAETGGTMTVRTTAYFDENCYRARFWSHELKFDSTRKVKESYWRELGIVPPPTTQTARFDKLAQSWAEREAIAIDKELREKPKSRKKSFAEVWELYKAMNPDEVAPSTIMRSEVSAKNVLAFMDGRDVTPDEIDIAFATEYRNWRKEDAAGKTILNELTFIKQMCAFAVAWSSRTGAEVLRLVKLPRVDDVNRGVHRTLTEEEFGRVLEHLKPRDQEIFKVGVTTRVRRANLLGFDASWIDRDARWLRVQRHLLKGGERKVKTDLSVPVAQWTLDVIGDRRSGLLWPNEQTGEAMSWYEHVLEDAIAKSGVDQFSLHSLRVTGATWLDAAGVDDLTIKVLLGHSTSGDVTNLYRKKLAPVLREAVDVYDQVRTRNRW
jgi:integrase